MVDEGDRVIGSMTLRQCLEQGMLHRAVAVLVMRSGGRFVLQQRSRRDTWHPGEWTISSTGHVKKGERYEAAAHRELNEELGIDGRLTAAGKYEMPPFADHGLTERELVVFFTCETDSPCIADPVELEGVKDIAGEELRGMIRDGPLTPDAKIILSDYLKRTTH